MGVWGVNINFRISLDIYMYPFHIKDIILGILVAYVSIDLLLSGHPGTILTLFKGNVDTGIVVVIGLAMGLLTYHFARKSRESFVKI